MFAIESYIDVVAAVARKQQVLSFILQGLVRTKDERETLFTKFVADNEDTIKAMPHEIATDSDVMDFCEAKSKDTVSIGELIDQCMEKVWEGCTIPEEEKKSFNKNLWDTLADELIQLINVRYELFKVENPTGDANAH